MRVISRDRLKPEKGINYTADHLLRMEKKGQFPKSFPLGGGGRVVYDADEVDRWLELQKRKARDGAVAGNAAAA